jgi:asparagine synthase (glutamine-hydrolysing)
MWALALWCARERRLVLSRDRFGIKPLYYSVRGDRVCFASEPKAILSAFPREREPDARELDRFLAGGAPHTSEATFFANVKSLAPATYGVFTRDREQPRTATYWGFAPGAEAPRADAEEHFRELLGDSVRLRTRSDVPVGACLSGGLDSSAIISLLERPGGEPTHCFSLRYDEPSFDESRYAALAARERGVVMHWVRPDPRELLETMRQIVWHHDGPTRMRGGGQWFVMREVGRHVKVVLDGQGGDELLAGYSHYAVPYLIDRLRLGVPSAVSAKGLTREIAELSRLETPRLWFLLTAPLRYLRATRPRTAGPYESVVNNTLWNELRHDGLPEVLHGEDISSMAFSVESRTPFLDHRLVELCFSLPFYDKISDGWTKSLLRRSLAGVVPAEILARRRKLGFSAPIADWLRLEPNKRAVHELLLDPSTLDREVADRSSVERDLKGLYGRRVVYPTLWASRLWRRITLELWFRELVDGAGFHSATTGSTLPDGLRGRSSTNWTRASI